MKRVRNLLAPGTSGPNDLGSFLKDLLGGDNGRFTTLDFSKPTLDLGPPWATSSQATPTRGAQTNEPATFRFFTPIKTR